MFTKSSDKNKRGAMMHGDSSTLNPNTNPFPDTITLQKPQRASLSSTLDAFILLSILNGVAKGVAKGAAKGAKAPASSISPTPPNNIFLQALNLITETAETHFLPRKNAIDDVMKLCNYISENEQIKVTVKNSRKGAAFASGGAFLGGLLGGPPGIFVGGALGSAVGWWMTSGKFLPLHQIIIDMSPQQKSKLYSEVMAVLGLNWGDLEQLINLVMENSPLQMKVYNTVNSFLKKEFGAKVVCG